MSKVKKILLGIGYWFVQLTWGSLMTVIGLFASLIAIVFLKGKVHKNGLSFIVEVGGNWGGVNFGAISLCGGYTTTCIDLDWFEHTRRHEFGHSLQNIIFGPLHPFIVAIPSAIRYQIFNYNYSHNKPNPSYDAVWFEHTASTWGHRAVNKIEGTTVEYVEE